ncbi:MAG TPA: bifunctional D-glycero-beta-D-manno-heptose-7-phosphate kinase/D-glycero-beta-D-manno-heptose 1-phosphate adenylyltransferase HldE [Alphaproteobacteria bacterium]|jgi:D-beta-D-heptose 7-phosphate kinase/D-beta-D-heptose 1-phosphate adenosyltransferase|nr:bifunctional D-glycero-beta-D-manno-heptose-7-phosphate kinase/D-glycero-beta-D-manno-heptose 1-phosphate adenylyltransferase HldE [Alphaproteobacteria bacterium]
MIDAGIIEQLETARGVRILIVGDIMLDRFVYGAAERLSPEAPVPVLRFDRESVMPGGAANVARNVSEFGASVELIGLVGRDGARDELKSLIEACPGCRLSAVESQRRRTTVKSRFVADRQQILRVDMEEAWQADGDEQRALIAAIGKAIDSADLVILSDYAKGVLTADVVHATIDLASGRGIPVVVDPKTVDFRRYRGATVVTPNLSELEKAVRRSCADDETVIHGAIELMGQADLGAVLVTRGGQGMTLVEGDREPLHLRTTARQVFDVSGAGDTVISVLAVLLAEGLGLPDAAFAANLAAGLVVEKLGTASVTREELTVEIRRRHEADWDKKIALVDNAVRKRRRWAAAKEQVVFTNGCFDLLHPGHISLLRQAKAAGDRLVVGLNSDASVARLKGPTRPVQDQDARALVLSALDCVDLVVIFGEDTPYELISALRPDVLVKGADYREDQVVGGDVVTGYGGRIMLATLEPNRSTTATIAKMRV